jgi:SAM-dependent methyltransferase
VGVRDKLSRGAVSESTPIASERIHRYALAARLCAGMRVVDLACGSGYGTAILRERATAVTGVDSDAALEFLSRDLAGDHDLIVCFDGLEHFADPAPVLARLEQHAQAGMKLILSVANSKGLDEARETFGRFGEVTVLYQFLAEGSLIRGETPSKLEGDFVLPEHGESECADTFIACVNLDAELSELGDFVHTRLDVAARSLDRANRELFHENGRLARELIASAESAAAMSERIAAMTDRAEFLQHRVEHLEFLLDKIARALVGSAESVAALSERNETLGERNAALSEQNAVLSERNESLQHRVRDLEVVLNKPRHQAIERARDRLARVPGLDRVARSLGSRLSRNARRDRAGQPGAGPE